MAPLHASASVLHISLPAPVFQRRTHNPRLYTGPDLKANSSSRALLRSGHKLCILHRSLRMRGSSSAAAAAAVVLAFMVCLAGARELKAWKSARLDGE